MKNGLSGLKNIIWAAAILIALIALLVGLVFSMSARYQGERMSGTLILGQAQPRAGGSGGADNVSGSASSVLLELPSTQKNGLEAVFGMTFLYDRTLAGLADYSNNYGGEQTASLWFTSGAQLSAVDAADTPIIFVDGSEITPANAAMVLQPKKLVIYLGSDALADADEQSFIEGYSLLVNSIRNSSPNTTVICCSIASVGTNFQRLDELSPSMIAKANAWIRQVCINTGAYYADLASVLNNEQGYMRDEFFAADGRGLNTAGIAMFVDYFRFHGI